MIALTNDNHSCASAQQLRNRFLELLPAILAQAHFAFRGHAAQWREELVAETVAACFVAYVRLVERGLDDCIYATPLAQYAIRQIYAGKRVGCAANTRDVTSPVAARRRGVHVERMGGGWLELLVEDRQAGPAQTAASRIDFEHWLSKLSTRLRAVAQTLALGETTKAAARQFGVTPGRISQMRRTLERSWYALHSEPLPV